MVENSKLIKSLYSRDEDAVSLILNKEDILIEVFTSAQIDGEDIKSSNKTPLPIQARYVLKAWNLVRLNASMVEKEKYINFFNKKAFDKSFFPQISKMCLAFDNESFRTYALDAYNSIKSNDQSFLFYKILAYYFRLKDLNNLKVNCISLSKSYKNKSKVDNIKKDEILNFLNNLGH